MAFADNILIEPEINIDIYAPGVGNQTVSSARFWSRRDADST
jgi:hypothetical protein